jgi:Methyltransferase domain
MTTLEEMIANGTWEAEKDNITANGMFQKIRDFGHPVRGIEVGVKEGWNSIAFLEKCPNIELLIGIDPYAPYDDMGYQWSQEEKDQHYEEMLYNISLRNLGSRYQHIREFSWDAASKIANNSLQFVFIDAEHSDDAITKDLDAYWPKLVDGGIMSGHDNRFVAGAINRWRDQNHVTSAYECLSQDSWCFVKGAAAATAAGLDF